MKITLKNLGLLKDTSFCLDEMTIICGKNNTGKTYATHATYAFFDYVLSNATFSIKTEEIDALLNTGVLVLNLVPYFENLQMYINDVAREYSNVLWQVFAAEEKKFTDTEFKFEFLSAQTFKPAHIKNELRAINQIILKTNSSENSDELEVRLIVDKDNEMIPPRQILQQMLGELIAKSILQNLIPMPFLASAERTGAAIFQKELDFTRNRLVDLLGEKSSQLTPMHFLSKFSGEYPIAVRRNVDFIRALPNITNKESFIAKEHPEILNSFRELVGGDYQVNKEGEIHFIPTNAKSKKFTIVESSSSVRSLLDIFFYLRHIAQRGTLLMIDEPELNLHPENQRKMARLLAMIVNAGIKVFITTHSDYIIRELNTLILLNNNTERHQKIAERYHYQTGEFLDHNKVKVYIAEHVGNAKKNTTLEQAKIDAEHGIEILSFDTTIENMNEIQDELMWGE